MIERVVLAWYAWLAGLAQGPVVKIGAFTEGLDLPIVVAVLLGVVGALSPCQLTTNLGALAYASGRSRERSPLTLALAYVAGKVSVYTVVGALVIFLGLQLDRAAIPVVLVARKALGPLMVVVGLAFVGVLRVEPVAGGALAERLRRPLAARGARGAYLLGVAFSFAFCPTLFWLFFGVTIPLALRSAGGWVFPGVFAVGSSLPLLAVAAVVAAGLATGDRVVVGTRTLERPIRVGAGLVLILAGVHDTVVYWLL